MLLRKQNLAHQHGFLKFSNLKETNYFHVISSQSKRHDMHTMQSLERVHLIDARNLCSYMSHTLPSPLFILRFVIAPNLLKHRFHYSAKMSLPQLFPFVTRLLLVDKLETPSSHSQPWPIHNNPMPQQHTKEVRGLSAVEEAKAAGSEDRSTEQTLQRQPCQASTRVSCLVAEESTIKKVRQPAYTWEPGRCLP